MAPLTTTNPAPATPPAGAVPLTGCVWEVNNNGNAPVHYPTPNGGVIKTKFTGERITAPYWIQNIDKNKNVYDGVLVSGEPELGWIYSGHLTVISGGCG